MCSVNIHLKFAVDGVEMDRERETVKAQYVNVDWCICVYDVILSDMSQFCTRMTYTFLIVIFSFKVINKVPMYLMLIQYLNMPVVMIIYISVRMKLTAASLMLSS